MHDQRKIPGFTAEAALNGLVDRYWHKTVSLIRRTDGVVMASGQCCAPCGKDLCCDSCPPDPPPDGPHDRRGGGRHRLA